jgi:NAD(P)-dependent dehydrogenase (short-subunit alcohol dehydrogenase family)
MRVIVIGGTGTIGSAVADALEGRGHEVVRAGSRSGDQRVDIASEASIEALYGAIGRFDAVVCAAGDAAYAPLDQLDAAAFHKGLDSKYMGQVNVVLRGLKHVADGGSFTLTSGILAREPAPGSAALSPVNAAVEAFAKAAALELPRGIRVNVVSPPWVAETLAAMGRDPSAGVPAAKVADAYLAAIEGTHNGDTLDARDFA